MAAKTRLIRPAQERDLPRIAEIHLKAYSANHFTSRLPASVLERYYGLFLGDGAETLLLVEDSESLGETILGFAVFGREIGTKISRFKRENFRAIAATSLRNPIAAAGKLARQVWNRATRGKPTPCADHLLLSIAAARSGTGSGRALLEAFVARTAAKGEVRVGLYVNANNLGAINVYVSAGFVFRELHGGQYYMERSLGN
jgi:ribosomal protein S18 acetylase RimI-like enzyme